jgi:hypothetical protein
MSLSEETRRNLKARGWGLLLALITVGPFVLPSILEPMDDAQCEAVTVTAFHYVMGNRQRFIVTSVTSGKTWEVGAANAPFPHEYRGPGVLAIRRGRWTGKRHLRLYDSCPAASA